MLQTICRKYSDLNEITVDVLKTTEFIRRKNDFFEISNSSLFNLKKRLHFPSFPLLQRKSECL